MKIRSIAIALLVSIALALPAAKPAQARGGGGLLLGLAAGAIIGTILAPPVYAQPRVLVAPPAYYPPAYYPPAPIYVEPAYEPTPYYAPIPYYAPTYAPYQERNLGHGHRSGRGATGPGGLARGLQCHQC